MQKWNLHEKLGKEHLNCKSQRSKSTLSQSQRWSTIWSTSWSTMMSVDDVAVTSANDVTVTWQWWRHLGLTSARGIWRVTARGGACGAREGSWQRVEARGARELLRRIFWRRWGRVAAPMMVRFSREGRSMEEDLSGTCKNTIGARITTATLWQWSRDY